MNNNEEIKIKATPNAGDENIPEFSDDKMTLYTRNLYKTYGKRTVVNDVSIHVNLV